MAPDPRISDSRPHRQARDSRRACASGPDAV